MTRFLREAQVCDAMGWSRSMLWKQIKLGRFPKPLPGRPNRWPETDVANVQQESIAARDAAVPVAA